MKKVAILQSNYLPWRGVFSLIEKSDIFVFHEDVQFTYQDWRTRNRIRASDGKAAQWITIPTGKQSNKLIYEVVLPQGKWKNQHLNKICEAYRKHSHFSDTYPFFEKLILDDYPSISAFNIKLTTELYRKIFPKGATRFLNSLELKLVEKKEKRVLEILEKLKATHYLSGPAGKNYLNMDNFEQRQIELHYLNYELPDYPQPLDAIPMQNLSIVDLIFNVGFTNANLYI